MGRREGLGRVMRREPPFPTPPKHACGGTRVLPPSAKNTGYRETLTWLLELKHTLYTRSRWEVLKVNSNDYTCVHVTERNEKVFHVDMLKPYYGTMAMAERAALLDKDMHVVVAVSAYCGDPWAPLGCEFLLHYEDGSDLWLKYKDDTSLKYCRRSKTIVRLCQNCGHYNIPRKRLRNVAVT